MKIELKDKKIMAKETVDILEYGFTREKTIHNGYKEYERAKEKYKQELSKFKLRQMFGKWHYIFKKGNHKISLIRRNDLSSWFWEIHAFEDKTLFSGCKKFHSKKEAMKEIINLLSD